MTQTVTMAGFFGLMLSCLFGIADIAWLCLAAMLAGAAVMTMKGN